MFMFDKGDKMSKILSRLKNWFNSYLTREGLTAIQGYIFIIIGFIGLCAFLWCFVMYNIHYNNDKPKIPDSITIEEPNTKIEYFTYSGEKKSESAINRFSVIFMDSNKPNCKFKIYDSGKPCRFKAWSDTPVVVFNGVKNYADIYNQNNLDFNSSKYNFLPVAFYKSFKSNWKDDNDGKAIFIYASPGKPIACFEGSHVSINSTAAKEVKEIHIDGHRVIIINSKYSVYKVGKLKDMYYRRIRLQKRDLANK